AGAPSRANPSACFNSCAACSQRKRSLPESISAASAWQRGSPAADHTSPSGGKYLRLNTALLRGRRTSHSQNLLSMAATRPEGQRSATSVVGGSPSRPVGNDSSKLRRGEPSGK